MTDIIEPELPLSEKREIALNHLASVIEVLWGRRCSRHEGGCHTCVAWTIFDTMEKLTDSSAID